MFYFNRHEFSKTGKPKKIRHNIINNQFILMGVIRDESSFLIIVFLKFPMWSRTNLETVIKFHFLITGSIPKRRHSLEVTLESYYTKLGNNTVMQLEVGVIRS